MAERDELLRRLATVFAFASRGRRNRRGRPDYFDTLFDEIASLIPEELPTND